jgi:PAS domain S-box-containing protein
MKTFKLKNSLSVKLLKLIFLVYLLITIITLSLQLYLQFNFTQEKVNIEVISIEKKFKDSLSTAVWNFSVEEISSILKGINNNQFISGVRLLDKNNILLDKRGDIKIKNNLKYSFNLVREYKGKKLLIGKVEIYSDPNIVMGHFKESVYFIVQNTFLVFFVISLVLVFIFYRYLTKPLNSLTQALEGLNLENLEGCKLLKENIDMDKKDKDEIELFKSSFIVMANKIISSSKELNTLNKTLEKKVLKRTQNLENEKNKVKTFLDAAMEAIIISKDGICIDVNHSALDIFGYESKDEVIGKHILEFIAEESKELVTQKVKLDDAKPYEGVVIKKDKTKLSALLRGHGVPDQNMRISSVIDISHLKQLESQTKMAALGEMIGNIAHQWRQPLSVISTAATGLELQQELGDLTDEQFIKYCKTIDENAQYLSKTIDDFKDFIKGDRKVVNFKLVDNIESFLHIVEGTIKNKNIKVIKNIDENINIDSYPNELQQCFINIFNNSKDAFKEDEEERLFFISVEIKENRARILFKDNAGGIPKDALSHIFEPYFTTKHKSQGTGLGLSMTYNLIVEGMHGTIEAKNTTFTYNNNEYTGAVFLIDLPLN